MDSPFDAFLRPTSNSQKITKKRKGFSLQKLENSTSILKKERSFNKRVEIQ